MIKYLLIPIWGIALLILSYLAFQTDKLFVIIALIVVVVTIMAIKWPEAATIVVICVLYTNLAVIAKILYHVPMILAGSFILLLVLPLANYMFLRGEKFVVDYIVLFMVLFLAIVLLSSLFAKDPPTALEWIFTYVFEGVILYLLVINVIRNLKDLKKVIWCLLFSCSLLGGLSLYQDATKSYSNTFWGLAQRKQEKNPNEIEWDEVRNKDKLFRTRDVGGSDRAGGPFGESNRYAQIMVVVLPLALFQYWREHSRVKRVSAAFAGMLILSGIMLSYSRSAFIAIVAMVLILTFLRYVRIYQLLTLIVVFIIFMFVVAPGYLVRVESILGVEGIISSEASHQPDAVTRGRLTEMLAALMAFLDHPLVGVGPGHYTPFYSIEYQLDPDIALRYLPKNRRAHTLYFELMAEVGIFGFLVFMAMPLYLMYRLWQIRKQAQNVLPDAVNIATALWFGIFAYLVTALFAHLAYQRYFWLLLAVAGSTIQVLQQELSIKKSGQSSASGGTYREEQSVKVNIKKISDFSSKP